MMLAPTQPDGLTLARRKALAALLPPTPLPLSEWLEANVCLPEGLVAMPGPLEAVAVPAWHCRCAGRSAIERVSVLKSARVGYTSLISGAIANYCANDPAPILVVMPTADDCRGIMVDDLEPLFAASPTLVGILPEPMRDERNRSTLLHRFYPGGSLKIVSARAPRNLRRHGARVLLLDEGDAMNTVTAGKNAGTSEGDPISLAEKRTLSFRNSKRPCRLDAEGCRHLAHLQAVRRQ